MTREQADDWVLAYVTSHPGCTAREIAAELGEPRVRSQQRNTVYVALGRLRLRGLVRSERDGDHNRWHRVAALERPVDREYVEIVLDRLASIWDDAPKALRHRIEWCQVDLQRALGQLPMFAEDLPTDLVHSDGEECDGESAASPGA